MEIRRVQVTGGSSYVITLPKEWVKSSSIKKNDPLGIFIQSDGTLMITSKMTKDQQQKIKEFDVTSISDKKYILRQLIAAYIAGYNTIKVFSQNRLTPEIRGIIRNFTQTTIGQEVIEETDKTIILKDLLNPTEMPFDRTIKRMFIIVKGMHEETIKCLENKDTASLEFVSSRDLEVNRLQWLIARQHNTILQKVSIAEKMNVTISLSSTYFLISRIIERIGDHYVKISKNFKSLIESNETIEESEHIIKASNMAFDIFNKSITAFFRKDKSLANESVNAIEGLGKLFGEIDNYALKQKGIIAISIGQIMESIRRIAEYARDISEHVINYVVSEQS